MTFILLLIKIIPIYTLITGVLFWKGFRKADCAPWKAFIPFYNIAVLLKIIQRPWWWIFLFFIPIVNNVMFVVIIFEWLRLFGYTKKRFTLIAILTVGLFIIYVNHSKPFLGTKDTIPKKSLTAWLGSVMFAVVAATIVHTYILQPYIIPTSSLEKTLLVGDFLLVSKFHYGARLPMTPLSVPMVHDTIPLLKVRSYIKNWQLPYMRLPAIQKVKRNDIVVFNWPTDTVRKFFDNSKLHFDKPIDKKSNYVKRCVGLPGDTLTIVDGHVFIDGKKNVLPDRARLQFAYRVKMKSPKDRFSKAYMRSRYGITGKFGKIDKQTYIFQSFPEDRVADLKKHPKVDLVERYNSDKGTYEKWTFPHNPEIPWNVDFLGPLYIPKKGSGVKLNMSNINIYRRIIEVYEGHDIKTEGLQLWIDGQLSDRYTFEKDYYWMMGDNRNASEDARIWGFVPEDHIVGKPIFIWMSIDWSDGFKIRWERLFTTISGEGKPISFFKYFIIAIGIWFAYKFWRKRKRSV